MLEAFQEDLNLLQEYIKYFVDYKVAEIREENEQKDYSGKTQMGPGYKRTFRKIGDPGIISFEEWKTEIKV